jgi:hypothetical protein
MEPFRMTRARWWAVLTVGIYGALKSFAVFQVARGVWLAPPGALAWGLWINAGHEIISLLLCGAAAGMTLAAIQYGGWATRKRKELRARRDALRGG